VSLNDYSKEELFGMLTQAAEANDESSANEISDVLREKQGLTKPGFLQKAMGAIGSAAGAVSDVFTGADRATDVTEQLPELHQSGLLSNVDPWLIAKISPAILTATSTQEISDIITSNVPDIIEGESIDAQGNVFPVLTNRVTGAATMINRPGLSPYDILQGLGIVAAHAPAARVAKGAGLLKGAFQVGAKSLGIEAGLQGVQQAAGGAFDPLDVALAGGMGAGGKALEKAMTIGSRLIRGQPKPQAQAAVEFGEQAGAPVFTADVVPPTTFAGKSGLTLAEKIPLAGTGGIRAAQQEKRSELVKEYVKNFGEFSPSEVYQSLERQTSKIKRAAGNRRGNIIDQLEGTNVTSTGAIDAIDKEIGRLSKTAGTGQLKKTADTQTIGVLENYRDDLVADPTFANLEELRTTFRESVKLGAKGDRIVLPNRAESSVQRIYGAMTEDMDKTVLENLGPQTKTKWKQANAIYANEVLKVKNTRLKNILKKGELTPEAANTMLYSNKPSEFMTLFKSLDNKGKSAARGGLIAKAWEKAGDSPDRFLNNINKISKQTGVSFIGKDKVYLKGLKNYLSHTKRAAQAAVTTKTGQEVQIYAVVASVLTDVMTATKGVITGTAAMYGVMAKMYEGKAVRNAMMKLANTKPGEVPFERAIVDINERILPLIQTQKTEKDKKSGRN